MLPLEKGVTVYKKLFEKEYSKNNLEELKRIRKTFNNYFKSVSLNWKVKKSFVVEELTEQEEITPGIVSDFLFYPIRKLYLIDGQDKQALGLRIRLIKRSSKKRFFKCIELDISYKLLQGPEWLHDKEITKAFKTDSLRENYSVFLKVLSEIENEILADKPKLLFTNQMGWIEGATRWHYVPITDFDKKELIYEKQLAKKLAIKSEVDFNEQESFNTVLKMLDLKDGGVATILFSYTLTSLFTSFIDYTNGKITKYMICLYGNKNNRYIFEYANLFCNLFNRRANISSLNEIFHSNLNCTEEELRQKALKIRDAIFIINAEESPRKISMAKKLLLKNECNNMMLILNNEPIEQDFFFNLSSESINSEIIKESKEYPALLTTLLSDIVHFYRNRISFEKNSKKSITKIFSKTHEQNQRYLEKNSSTLELNKVNYFSSLLIGFTLFLNYGLKIGAIDETQYKQHLDNTVKLFREKCVIHHYIDNEDNKSHDIHIMLLQTLLNMMEISKLPNISEKNNTSVDNSTNIGWKENDDIFQLRSNIFDKIEKLLISSGKQNIKFQKGKIYYKLFENQIVAPREGETPEKAAAKYFEYSINVASTPSTVRVFKFNKKKAIEFIKKVQG